MPMNNLAKDDINAYLNSILPKGYKVPERSVLTKKEIESVLVELAKKDNNKFGEVVQAIKRVGDELATTQGISIGLSDLMAPSSRNGIIKKLQMDLNMAAANNDIPRIAQLIAEADKKLQEESLKLEGAMPDFVKSGARGNARQLSQTIASPVGGSIKGKPLPIAIQHSFSEGLPFPEFFAVADPGREATFQTRTAISEPGAATKMLVQNMNDLVVTEKDCGTREGEFLPITDPSITGRFLCDTLGNFRRGTTVDTQVLSYAKKHKIDKIKVRTPQKCASTEGLCAKCYGLNEYGRLPELGVNLGIRSAQAMSEPLSQFALNAKHGSRSIAVGTSKSGMKYINQLFRVPVNFPNAAVLSEVSGTVRRVELTPLGDYSILVEPIVMVSSAKIEYVIPRPQKPVVKEGQVVDEGDPLSDGVVNPVKVVAAKGPAAGRKVISDLVNEAYINTGQSIDPRHFEMYSRGVLRYAKIRTADNKDFITGDIVELKDVLNYISKNNVTVNPLEAFGKYVAVSPGHEYPVGTRITPFVATKMVKSGIDKIKVNEDNFDFEPALFSAEMNPVKSPDWLAAMGSRNLTQVMKEAAMFGKSAKIKDSVKPTGPYVFGEHFNRPSPDKPGRY